MFEWIEEELRSLTQQLETTKAECEQLRQEVLETQAKGYGRLTDLAAQVDTLRKQVAAANLRLATGAEPTEADIEALREALAKYAHDAWSGWMVWQFGKGRFQEKLQPGSEGVRVEWHMPPWAVERWVRQMNTSYADLPEEEKQSDREEADKIIAVLAQHIAQVRRDNA